MDSFVVCVVSSPLLWSIHKPCGKDGEAAV